MFDRLAVLLASGVILLALGGCQPQQPARVSRPTGAQIAAVLPRGAEIEEIAYADLTGDGRDEVLISSTIPFQSDKLRTAVAFAPDARGEYAQVLAHTVFQDHWLPIQVGRRVERMPVAAVFAANGGSGAYLAYLVVQYAGVLQVTLENDGIFKGSVRFVSEGLLETSGDTSRLYRWTKRGWEAEHLTSQYLPPLPPGTIIVPYVVDPTRGPTIQGPRSIRARVGQHIFLRRMNPGEPSRILMSGGVSHESAAWRPDGTIALLQPDRIEISIENPAYGNRVLAVTVQVVP